MINVSNPKFWEIRQFMVSGYKKPNAAVGQSSLQALYETMFRNYGIMVGQVVFYIICCIPTNHNISYNQNQICTNTIVYQVLVTKPDFYHKETCKELVETISELLQLNIIPIINTNDAVNPPVGVDDADGSIRI